MKRMERTGMYGNCVACPLCGHTGAEYKRDTEAWACRYCDYSWHLIEHCSNRWSRKD